MQCGIGQQESRMNNEPVVWKAYEEVHFNDQYILRWVREGDEYVNKITKEMMEDLKSVVRQQQAELDRAVELYTDKAIENEALLKFIDERGETGQLIIWKAQEK